MASTYFHIILMVPWEIQLFLIRKTINIIVIMCISDYIRFQGQGGMIDFKAPQANWDSYLESMSREREWADAGILVAMAHMLRRDILVVTSSPQGTSQDQTLQWIVGDMTRNGEPPLMLGHVHERHYRSLGMFPTLFLFRYHDIIFI